MRHLVGGARAGWRSRSEGARCSGAERGAVATEFVLLVPVLMLLLAVVVGGARIWWAKTSVHQLAASAARQASIARTAGDAQAKASALVAQDAAASGLDCGGGGPALSLDTSGFGAPVGEAATVMASVSCAVPLSDVLLPGVPGSFEVDATAASTLDRYRARG